MNYRVFASKYMQIEWGIAAKQARYLADKFWAVLAPVFKKTMEQVEGTFFGWEQMHDSLLRGKSARSLPPVSMTPGRVVAAEILHRMLGVEDYVSMTLSPVEPVEPAVVEANPGNYNALFGSTQRIGPVDENGDPVFHYEVTLHVDPPEQDVKFSRLRYDYYAEKKMPEFKVWEDPGVGKGFQIKGA